LGGNGEKVPKRKRENPPYLAAKRGWRKEGTSKPPSSNVSLKLSLGEMNH